jgi:hypothetical protein
MLKGLCGTAVRQANSARLLGPGMGVFSEMLGMRLPSSGFEPCHIGKCVEVTVVRIELLLRGR